MLRSCHFNFPTMCFRRRHPAQRKRVPEQSGSVTGRLEPACGSGSAGWSPVTGSWCFPESCGLGFPTGLMSETRVLRVAGLASGESHTLEGNLPGPGALNRRPCPSRGCSSGLSRRGPPAQCTDSQQSMSQSGPQTTHARLDLQW